MATVETVTDNIIKLVQDDGYTSDDIVAMINRCLKYISTQVLLKSLETVDNMDILSSTYQVDIPESISFNRNLFDCETPDTTEVQILTSIEHLNRVYPNFRTEETVGAIEYALVHKNQLIYYPIPSEDQTVSIGFFKTMPEVTDTTELTDILPLGLDEDLIENYVAYKIYNRVEDSVDGVKVNANSYLKKFEDAMAKLEDVTETGQSRALPRRTSGWV